MQFQVFFTVVLAGIILLSESCGMDIGEGVGALQIREDTPRGEHEQAPAGVSASPDLRQDQFQIGQGAPSSIEPQSPRDTSEPNLGAEPLRASNAPPLPPDIEKAIHAEVQRRQKEGNLPARQPKRL